MKHILIISLLLSASGKTSGQVPDSLYFNLYTDSLKKGTYNYINVEGRYPGGRYLPLGDKEIRLTSSGGKFIGNSLFIDSTFPEKKVTVRAEATGNARLTREIVIYIKQQPDNERLPTMEEVLNKPSASSDSAGRKKKSRKKKR